jgi:uncharacterized membrane protein YfcA
MLFPTLVLLGLLTGALIGATGVGAGSLMTPMLIGVFRLPLPLAIGTDLCFAALTKLGGALAHWRQGHVDRALLARMLLGSLPACALTLLAMHQLGWARAGQGVLRTALGVALLLTAAMIAGRGVWGRIALRAGRRIPGAARDSLTVALGCVLGVLVTLSSVGAGAIGSTLIALLHPRLRARRLVGTDIAHAVPLSLLAGAGHAWMGHVDWRVLAALLLGSLPGIWLGARASAWLPERITRALLAATLLGAGLRML